MNSIILIYLLMKKWLLKVAITHRKTLCGVLSALILPFFIFSCKTTSPALSLGEKIASGERLTYKRTALSKDSLKVWPLMDIVTDSIPGISLEKAKKVVEGRTSQPVVVAVIDSGVDIDHQNLKDNIWQNEDELADNGLDDDRNGYVDDVTGWNFLEEVSFAPFAITRMVASSANKFDGLSEDVLKAEEKEEYDRYQSLRAIYDERAGKAADAYATVSAMYRSQEPSMLVNQMYNHRFVEKEYHYNLSYDPREQLGDDPGDMTDRAYGNGDVLPKHDKETHGTHVSGIIAGVIDHFSAAIKLMPIRAIPKGDEYDKDVALAIRYAVDNGADIINMSFGKEYSEYSSWVYEAIGYAAQKDVLLVHGAGNSAQNVDTVMVYPNDHRGAEASFVDNFLNVGASTRFYNKKLVAPFSNFGKMNVDIFAPGINIYSAVPGGGYANNNGTSMAAPLVAGVAAVIRSYYPALPAREVKRIIMDSGLEVPFEVVVPGMVVETRSIEEISRSGRILNAYNALLMASEISKLTR